MSTILAAVFAALLAGTFALLGAIYGSRREHTQWLRDTRRAAYERVLTSLADVASDEMLRRFVDSTFSRVFPDAPPESREAIESKLSASIGAYAELFSAISAVQVAGPAAVANAAITLQHAAQVSDNVALTKANEAFVLLARETLGSE